MGTNYYATRTINVCAYCGRADEEELHIGKSSAGWVFALHIYPEQGIHDLQDWKAIFANPAWTIKSEYGETVSKEAMVEVINSRKWLKPIPESELVENEAERGPNGLMRSIVDGKHCVGHGEGTWDYFVSDFS